MTDGVDARGSDFRLHVRIDDARGKPESLDAGSAIFEREGSREHREPGLGGTVGAPAFQRPLRRPGRKIDDASSPSLDHSRQDRLACEGGADQGDLNGAREGLRAHDIEKTNRRDDAGIVNEDRGFAEAPFVSETSLASCSRSITSQATAMPVPARNVSTTASAFACSRADTITRAPLSAKDRAAAAPMRRPAPVMKAISSLFARFAASLRRDFDAISAALE
jgi:hypothetical protein